MMTLHSPHLVALSEGTLLRALTSERRRPNLMVLCNEVSIDAALRHLVKYCEPPYHLCALPGPLDLPLRKKGTLLLRDVGRMTLRQQLSLYDWLSTGAQDLQIVSVARSCLIPQVECGEFFEGLFYRLNVISLDATPNPTDEDSRH